MKETGDMTSKLQFDLVTPETLLLSTQADMVNVPGVEGDFGVMVQHSPLMSLVRAGVIYVENDKERLGYFVRGGFANATPAHVTILAEHVLPLKDLTMATLEAEIKAVRDSAEDSQQAKQDIIDALEAVRPLI
ncbi:MAG: ATP synthase F1 subunit epsilon [Alphaproteobacteria bacterium]|nr:ATP synthase F1 subunit epsilon [Alphaproteobacteria bacterium]